MQNKILSRFQTTNDFPNSIPTSKLAQSNPFPSSSNLIFHCKVTQILSAILRNPSKSLIFSLYEICIIYTTVGTIKYCVQITVAYNSGIHKKVHLITAIHVYCIKTRK